MKNELYKLCKEMNITPYLIFENVFPHDQKIIDDITDLLDTGIPILVDAADVSWISRRRLIWTDFFSLRRLVNSSALQLQMRASTSSQYHGRDGCCQRLGASSSANTNLSS